MFKLQWQEYGMGKQKEGIFLSQKEILTWNFFENWKLDLEFSIPEEQRGEEILT